MQSNAIQTLGVPMQYDTTMLRAAIFYHLIGGIRPSQDQPQ